MHRSDSQTPHRLRLSICHADAVQDAARAAALEVVKELQQQGSLGRGPSSVSRNEQSDTSSTGSSTKEGIAVPKGYKGGPSDTRADAFRKMQVRLCLVCKSENSSACMHTSVA